MQMIAGSTGASEGKISYLIHGASISGTAVYQQLAWAAPGVSLFLDLSLKESIKLHFSFKKCLLKDPLSLAEILDLEKHLHKPLKFFSSGMLQRFSVGLALISDTPLLLLDEPTSNLDEIQSAKLIALIQTYCENRTLILASNLGREAHFIQHVWELKQAN